MADQEVRLGEVVATTIVCSSCGDARTDEPDYTPLQPMMDQPLGWYSGDDGELCPKDMAELMATGNRQPYRYHEAGGGIGVTSR